VSRSRPSSIASRIVRLNSDEQVVFALEVEIDGAGGDAGAAGDVRHLRGEEAAFREDAGRGVEDRVALRGLGGAGGLAHGRVTAAWGACAHRVK
jgi:hypothetical protein